VRRERAALACLLALTLAHGVAVATVRPMFQISDEAAYLASAQRAALRLLPAGDARARRVAPPDGQILWQWSQGKPAFEALAGRLLLWLTGRWPPADAAVLLRLVFSLSNVLAVYWAYRAASLLASRNPLVAWGTPTLVALQPVFVGYGAAVAPDGPANALSAFACWQLVRFALGQSTGPATLLPFVGAAAALAFKDTALGLAASAAAAIPVRLWRLRGQRSSSAFGWLRRETWIGLLPAVAIAAAVFPVWSFLRSPYFTDRAAAPLWPPRPALLVALGRELTDQLPVLFHSFWANLGNFGGGTVHLPGVLFWGLSAMCALAGVGLLALALAPGGAWPRGQDGARWPVAVPFGAGLLVVLLQAPIRQIAYGSSDLFQGRWLFPMMVPLALALTAGLSRWLREPGRALPLLAFFMATVAATGLLGVLVPYYYVDFPRAYDAGHLFLSGPYGLPLHEAGVEAFLERPPWLRSLPAMTATLGALLLLCVAWAACTIGLARRALADESGA